jgi:hypothetical protein
MIIALLFMFLCLTVGAIVLSAASASAGRLITAKTNQQNYLTVSSAASLIRNAISGTTFTGVEIKKVDSRGSIIPLPNPVFGVSPFNPLPTLVGNKAAQVFQVNSSFNPSGLMPSAVPLQIAYDNEDSEFVSKFDNVNASFTIQSDYSLKITLSTSSSPASYPLTLTIPASVNDITANEIDHRTETKTVDDVTTEVPYTITTTTHTVIVTWGGGVIS